MRASSVLHFERMGNTLTVRIPPDLAEWLDAAAKKAGLSKGKIVRAELERARKASRRPFMRWAGVIDGPSDLSMRKGFSKK